MEWYKSKKGWTTAVIAGSTLIAEHVLEPWELGHAAISIYETFRINFHYIKPWIAPALFVLALFFFERDRRKSKAYDLRTIKGRTLQLRSDLQSFLDSAPRFAAGKFDSETQVGYVKRVEDCNRARGLKLIHGYELHFAPRVLRTYHEYGERGWGDNELTEIVVERFKGEASYPKLIRALGRLAEQTELMEADPTLGWTDIANLTIQDREKLVSDLKQRNRKS